VTVKSAEIDTNFDDRIDIFDFNFTMKTDVSEIRNVKLLTFFDYKLRDVVKIDLRGMAMVDVNTPMGASSIYIDGELQFVQKNGVGISTTTNTIYNETLLHFESTSANYLPLLLERFSERNETTSYVYSNPIVLPYGHNAESILHLKIRVPAHQNVGYIPPFLESAKFAWTQYMMLLIPVYLIMFASVRLLFRQQILHCAINKPGSTYKT